jgi:general stress protein 26
MSDHTKIQHFVVRSKVAFIASVDEAGFPNLKAMLPPRKIEGCGRFISTNTSSMRVRQYRENN